MQHKHYQTITDYFSDMGLPPPEHPLFAIVSIDTTNQLDCPNVDFISSTDFYAISLKRVIAGEIIYGKTEYDCNSGTMLFLAPKQEFRTRGIKVESKGHLLLIHADYIKGHELESIFKNSNMFSYYVNEALHLSPKEERLMENVYDNIRLESQAGYDEHSREILLSQVITLMNYATRFYKRQFIQRAEISGAVIDSFNLVLEKFYQHSNIENLPTLAHVAETLGFSQRYLSDALKAQTNISAKEHLQVFIIEKAKSILASTELPVTNIAYQLGYDTPQYFARIFKSKTGVTPTEFRAQLH